MLQKGPETEKKVLLRVGLNPQLRWLTNVCLRGFDRNVQQLFTVFPLHQFLFLSALPVRHWRVHEHWRPEPVWGVYHEPGNLEKIVTLN